MDGWAKSLSPEREREREGEGEVWMGLKDLQEACKASISSLATPRV
jgi:hypothetical protein